jgi:hypothetical protein
MPCMVERSPPRICHHEKINTMLIPKQACDCSLISTYRKCQQEESIGETHDYRDENDCVAVDLLLWVQCRWCASFVIVIMGYICIASRKYMDLLPEFISEQEFYKEGPSQVPLLISKKQRNALSVQKWSAHDLTVFEPRAHAAVKFLDLVNL